MSIFDLGQGMRDHSIFIRITTYIFEHLTNSRKSIKFIQAGSNDGENGDPINPFVKSGHWIGVMIEPVPDTFTKLRNNYASVSGVAFENCAIGPEDGNFTFYAVKGDLSVLSGFDKRVIMTHADWVRANGWPDLESSIEEISVPVFTLKSMCRRHDIDSPDIFVIDTEGYDCKIILSMDTASLPVIIHFEHKHCQDIDTINVRDFLQNLGYELLFDNADAVAVLPGVEFPLSQIRLFQDILKELRS